MAARHQIKLHQHSSACYMSLSHSYTKPTKSTQPPASPNPSTSVKSCKSTQAPHSECPHPNTRGPIWRTHHASPPKKGAGGAFKPSIRDSGFGRRCRRGSVLGGDVKEDREEKGEEDLEEIRQQSILEVVEKGGKNVGEKEPGVEKEQVRTEQVDRVGREWWW